MTGTGQVSAAAGRLLLVLMAAILCGIAPTVAQDAGQEEPAPPSDAASPRDETVAVTQPEETEPVPGADRVEEGEWMFRELRFKEAIETLTGAIEEIGPNPADELARDLVTRALDLRAQARLSLGQTKDSDSDFEALVRHDPAYELDELTVSPKIVERFRGIRETLVGYLSVTCRPRDAHVSIDGRASGICPILERPVLAGDHTVSGEMAAFDPGSEVVSVKVGEIAGVRLSLTPNARTVLLRTIPSAVEVYVDDEPAGITVAGAMGDDGESEPLVLAALGPGEHRFNFQKECWADEFRSFMVVVDMLDVTPVVLEPVRLSSAVSSVSVRSEPGNGLLVLDGVESGRTPVLRRPVCAGERSFEVRFSDDVRWRETLTVFAGEALELEARPRPDMKFRLEGFPADNGGFGGGAAESPAAQMRAMLRGLKRFNVIELPDEPGRPDDADMDAMDARSGAWDRRPTGPTELSIVVRDVSAPAGRPRVQVTLDSAHGDDSETWVFDVAANGDLSRFLEDLDAPVPFERHASGLILIDTLLSKRPVVLESRAGSPAARAGLLAGDVITAVEDEPAESATEVAKRLRASRSDRPVRLQIRGADGRREVTIAAEPSGFIVPFARAATRGTERGAAPLSYHKVAVEASLAATISPAGSRRAAARLNLAAALLHFGRDTEALQGPLARAQPKVGSGVSLGTAHYLRGVALERLGRTAEAAAEFGLAAASPQATLDDLEGPALSEAARTRAEALATSP